MEAQLHERRRARGCRAVPDLLIACGLSPSTRLPLLPTPTASGRHESMYSRFTFHGLEQLRSCRAVLACFQTRLHRRFLCFAVSQGDSSPGPAARESDALTCIISSNHEEAVDICSEQQSALLQNTLNIHSSTAIRTPDAWVLTQQQLTIQARRSVCSHSPGEPRSIACKLLLLEHLGYHAAKSGLRLREATDLPERCVFVRLH